MVVSPFRLRSFGWFLTISAEISSLNGFRLHRGLQKDLNPIVRRIFLESTAHTDCPTSPRLVHLYGLPKRHEEYLAMHPTLSATQTYNYTLARCLDTSLTPLSLNCYTVTEIFQFANEIRNLKIANGDILVSCLPCLLTYP